MSQWNQGFISQSFAVKLTEAVGIDTREFEIINQMQSENNDIRDESHIDNSKDLKKDVTKITSQSK